MAPTAHYLLGAISGLYPSVGTDPPRILNGQPCLWEPFVGAFLHIYVGRCLRAADIRAA